MKFEPLDVTISELLLDPKNPRFLVSPNSDQTSIIEYILEYEKVVELAKSINDFGGLIPGERIIVCHEDNQLIVLEGNRRVTACKLLINRQLVPKKFLSRFPEAKSETIENLKQINVDLVASREDAQSTLYIRHLEGVRNWSPLSKKKFFANEFKNGKTISEIREITKSNKNTVIKGIREYNFIVDFLFELENWNDVEKEELKRNIHKIKIDPFLRVFNSNSDKFGKSAASILKMEFDSDSYTPISSLTPKVFHEGIYLIAKAAFFNKEFTTRSHVEHVPGFIEFMEQNRLIEIDFINDKKEETASLKMITSKERVDDEEERLTQEENLLRSLSEQQSTTPETTTANNPPVNQSNKGEEKDTYQKGPKALLFFHNLTWKALNPSDPDQTGMISIADEIQRLSHYNMYSRYPVATGMLLRALLEQSLKYHIKQTGEWDELLKFISKPNGYDPMLRDLVKFLKHNNRYMKSFGSRTTQSAFIVSTDASTLDLLDTNIHNTQYVRVTKTELENLASKGLFQLINSILNKKYVIPPL